MFFCLKNVVITAGRRILQANYFGETERIQSYGWADINLSYENAVNQNKKKMFVFACGKECCGGAREIGEEKHCFCEDRLNIFWKLRKVEEYFNAK